jgi:hypothetical protein
MNQLAAFRTFFYFYSVTDPFWNCTAQPLAEERLNDDEAYIVLYLCSDEIPVEFPNITNLLA